MLGGLNTDEYTISISREIVVCQNMITAAARRLEKFEKQHGFTTAELLVGHDEPADGSERITWLETHAGLLAWRQRLQEYEEAYSALKK